MRQRLFSLGGRYDIRTDQDVVAWIARVRMMSLSPTIELRSGDDRPVGRLRRRVFSFPGTWDLTRVDGPSAVLKRGFRILGGSLTITEDGGRIVTAEGDFLKREYVIEADGHVIALVSKKFFSVRDEYGIELSREGDAPHPDDVLPIAVALVVDRAHHEHQS